jgi:hypothetical protein
MLFISFAFAFFYLYSNTFEGKKSVNPVFILKRNSNRVNSYDIDRLRLIIRRLEIVETYTIGSQNFYNILIF